MKNNAFIDANVLVDVLNNTNSATKSIKLLRDAGFKIYTFRKCIYEVYSVIKGTNKKPGKNPFKHLFPKEINDIAQKLFRGKKEIDTLANAYYWYNLCEEWRRWDYFEVNQANIEKYVEEPDREKALEWLEIRKEFVKWKEATSKAFSTIDKLVADNEIIICEYFQVY